MSNNMYTHEERRIIVKYLIDNNISGNLQGNALWKRMEQEGVLNRTWQSMRSQFKNTIINMLHLYGLTEKQERMILHGFGRKKRPHVRHSSRPAPLRRPIPFSSDSDSDTTLCVDAQAKRRKRDSASSLDLLSCNTNTDNRTSNVSDAIIDHNQPSTSRSSANTDNRTSNISDAVIDHNRPSTSTSSANTDNRTSNVSDAVIDHYRPSTSMSSANWDIRSYLTNTGVGDNDKPTSSTPNIRDRKISRKHRDSVVIIDSDDDAPIKTEVSEQKLERNNENEPFSLEEDTRLIMYFNTNQNYLADVRNKFVYIAFNYDTPSSLRAPKELKTRFLEHIMPKLFTYDCLTYEEMVTYYDRTDIDVPIELQQLIRKRVAEQKKNKQLVATKLAVYDSTQAQQLSNKEKTIRIDVELDNTVQDQPNPLVTCTGINVVRRPAMVDASTQVQPAAVDNVCNRKMVDATTQVQPGRVCNTMINASTQVSQANASPQQHIEEKVCDTNTLVQHVHFITDNMLHIYLPEHDMRTSLQDLENIHESQKTVHKSRPKQYRMLNDTRYVDVATDPAVRQIAIEKCQAEMLRLTGEMKRLEVTLCKLKGYETKDAVSENQENLVVKNEQCPNVSDTSIDTIILSSSLADGEATVSAPTDNAGSQTGNQTDVCQTESDKKHISTQTSDSQSDEQQLHTANTSQQDGDQEEISEVIAIQPDIEVSTRQPQQPMEVEQTSDESEVPEVHTDPSALQTEPLNLSTTSHESDSADNVNTAKFYSALSQN